MLNTEHIVENRSPQGKRRNTELFPLPSKEQLEYEEEALPLQEQKRGKYNNKNQPTYSEEVNIKKIVTPQRESSHTLENTSNILATNSLSISPYSPGPDFPNPLEKYNLPSRLPYMVDKKEGIYIPNMPPILDNGVPLGVQLGIISDIQWIYKDLERFSREAAKQRVSLGDSHSQVST